MNYPHPLIAKEGWPFIAINFFAILFSYMFLPGWITFLLFVGLVFVIQFFRDPPRPVSDNPDEILCPADGLIVKVEKAHNPYTDQDALLISVFMNVFNVHSNRSSVKGIVEKVQYTSGSYLNAKLDKASTQNERNAVVIRTEDDKIITQVQIAGLIARRILCYVKAGDTLDRGDRYGFIRFGSRVDMYLPLDVTPCVAPGDKVYATSTVLAMF